MDFELLKLLTIAAFFGAAVGFAAAYLFEHIRGAAVAAVGVGALGGGIGGGGGAIIVAITAIQLLQSYTPGQTILPTRMFAGPTQYPPQEYKAYGIVAFPSRNTADDKPRFEMICDAYRQSLLHITEARAPHYKQMVTVWPIDSDEEADEINRISREKVCERAVPRYGLKQAQEAIGDAKQNGASLKGRGPFLLAWAPGAQMGQPDALVLVANLSNIEVSEDATSVFNSWASDIKENPKIWDTHNWELERVRLTIRYWVDRYGEDILSFYKKS
jgi:hypothetical protein